MSVISGGKVIEGVPLEGGSNFYIYEYDFAVDGGAIGAKNLRAKNGAPPQLPSGFIVTDTIIDVQTVCTSATNAGTIAVKLEAANDIVSAAAVSGAPFSSTGRKAGVPVSAATSLKLTAARYVVATVAVEAITAGKFYVAVLGYDPSRD